MDIDALFDRPTLEGSPVSLLVRFVPKTKVVATTNRALDLLEGLDRLQPRPAGDEVVLLVDPSAPRNIPARVRSKRVKLLVFERPDSGAALAAGIEACQNPAIVFCDGRLTLQPEEMHQLLQRLNHADIVTTVRPGRSHKVLKTFLSLLCGTAAGWLAYTYWLAPLTGFCVGLFGSLLLMNLGLLVRRTFGVPVSDPICPVKAVRKSAVEGVPLQCDQHLAEMELIAKLTFMTALIDEMPVADVDAPATMVESMKGQWRAIVKTFWAPKFWRFDPSAPRFRPPTHEMPAPVRNQEKVRTPVPFLPRPAAEDRWKPAYPKRQWPLPRVRQSRW